MEVVLLEGVELEELPRLGPRGMGRCVGRERWSSDGRPGRWKGVGWEESRRVGMKRER